MSCHPGLSYPTKGVLCDLDCPFLPHGPGMRESFSGSTKCPWIRGSWALKQRWAGGLAAGATAACDRSVQQPLGVLHYDVVVRHQTWNSAFLAANNVLYVCVGGGVVVNCNLLVNNCIRSSQYQTKANSVEMFDVSLNRHRTVARYVFHVKNKIKLIFM